MIVKFFRSGISKGESPINYLIGSDRDRPGARVMMGDPDLIIRIINSTKFTKKYTSGVLSFSESDISDELLMIVMLDFEKTILPGISPSEYSFLWVKHEDKGRVELHFVIPTLNLASERRLQPYYVGQDFYGIDAWQTMINIKYKFEDPEDPLRAKKLFYGNRLNLAVRKVINILIELNVEEKYFYDKSCRKLLCSRKLKSMKIKRERLIEKLKVTKSKIVYLAVYAFNKFVCKYYFGDDTLRSASAFFYKLSKARYKKCCSVLNDFICKKTIYNKMRHPDYINDLGFLESLRVNNLILNAPLKNDLFYVEDYNVDAGAIDFKINGCMHAATEGFEGTKEFCRKLYDINSRAGQDLFDCIEDFSAAVLRVTESISGIDESTSRFTRKALKYLEINDLDECNSPSV